MSDVVMKLAEALSQGADPRDALRALGFADPDDAARGFETLWRAEGVKAQAPALLPAILRGPDPARTARLIARFAEQRRTPLAREEVDILVELCAHTAQFVRRLSGDPVWLARLAQSEPLRAPRTLEAMQRMLRRAVAESPADVGAILRRFCAHEHARIAYRDIAGADIDEIVRELADVAEAAIDVATHCALEGVQKKYGHALKADGSACAFAVLGMGKLGGRELNFSSDVDLIFVYETDDGRVEPARAGGGELTIHELMTRVAREVTRVLSEPTAHGIAFRVDLDLRPEGRKGALVNSIASLESYYEAWGQTWERAALIKARGVGGDRSLAERVAASLEPFVFRRTIDPSIVDEIRDMKERIDADERRRGGAFNVKLGRGGIREIEFFVQAHQLLFAGKRPVLRERGTLDALRALEAESLLRPFEANALRDAYLFLRRVEHRLQMDEGRQLHRLPESMTERARLARSLGYGRERSDDLGAAARLERDILKARRVVMSAFDGLQVHSGSPAAADSGDEGWPPALAGLSDAALGQAPDEDAAEALRANGVRDVDAAFAELARVARTRGTPLHPASPPRARALAPRLWRALRHASDPDMALRHACDFLVRMRGRLGTFALLRENPATLRTLVDLFGTSDFLARLVVLRPELLDPLIIGVVRPRRAKEELVRELRERCRSADDEGRLDGWRQIHAEELLRIGLSDVSGLLDFREVHVELTALAEAILEEVLAWSIDAALRAPSEPAEGAEPAAQTHDICVVGMGKLGGGDLNYNSDLDLLFLFSGDGGARLGDGGRIRQEHFARVAQKILFGLTCVTSAGVLYHIDARLRPSGRQGSLVSSLDAFRAYHDASAQVWERLALVRARPVAGPEPLRESAMRVITHATYERPLPPEGVREIARLRERMERENAREDATRFDVKLGRGGLVDVEFATQLLQLRAGREEPRVRVPSTLAALAALEQAGAWPNEDLAALRDGYTFLRRVETRLRIVHDNAQSVLGRDPRTLDAIARRAGISQGGAALERELLAVTSRNRGIYSRVIEALS